MYRITQLLFLLLACVCQVRAQLQEPVRFTVEQKKTADNEIQLLFHATIEKGWHVYAPQQADDGPVATTLTLEQATGVKPKGELAVQGAVHKAMDEMFGMEVSYVENEATFVQTFVITDANYELTGYLTYGACNDQNCMPPTNVEFSFSQTGASSGEATTTETNATEELTPSTLEDSTQEITATSPSANLAQSGYEGWWAPVIDELQSFGMEESEASNSLWQIFLLGILGGFVALLTPCVWPIIPMTVSFFLKRSQDKARGIRDAMTYGIAIVVIYVLLGLLVTLIFGASALNALSTNALFNLFFFLMLVVFAASFLGGFEITLPSSWTNAVDKKSESTTGLLSIFLMAFTLCLVSFSCTGPIIGFLLVEVSTSGSVTAPAIGMFGFALALALPFTLFAIFPAWLKSAPKSGNWMNCIKVCLGFLELAFALKFLSVADLAYGWGILDREVFLCLWIMIFALLGAYLIGWIRFPHDEEEYDEMGEVVMHHRTSVPRFFAGLVAFAFALYMVPGLWGAPCKAVSAFAPPMSTQDFNLSPNEAAHHFHDYEQGMQYAQQQGMPVMVDFTGYGCVNCRKMEASVWTDPKVAEIMNERYVLITLHVDDKTPLPEPIEVKENGDVRKLRTVGDKWSYLQRSKFGANAQPFYVLLDNEGKPLNGAYSYNEQVEDYIQFLNEGLRRYE